MSFSARFALPSAALMAGTGPMPMRVGSTPTDAHETSSHSGVRPSAATAASLATTSVAAPSQMPEAEAGVTTPSFLNAAGSFCSFSSVVFGFGCSSTANSTSLRFTLSVIGATSASYLPAACAAPHRVCDACANASASARVMS